MGDIDWARERISRGSVTPSLQALQSGFGRLSGAQAQVAYAISALAVRRMLDESGGFAVANLLRDLGDGADFNTAFLRRMNSSFERFQATVAATLMRPDSVETGSKFVSMRVKVSWPVTWGRLLEGVNDNVLEDCAPISAETATYPCKRQLSSSWRADWVANSLFWPRRIACSEERYAGTNVRNMSATMTQPMITSTRVNPRCCPPGKRAIFREHSAGCHSAV